MKPNLEQYLKANHKKGFIDHQIRTSIDSMGNIAFYIYPLGIDGDTLDFMVNCNRLTQLFVE